MSGRTNFKKIKDNFTAQEHNEIANQVILLEKQLAKSKSLAKKPVKSTSFALNLQS
jgi:hypothetical protein